MHLQVSLPVQSMSLIMRIDNSKQICLSIELTAIKGEYFFYLLSLQLVLCRVAVLKYSQIHRP